MQTFGVTNKEHYGMLWYFLWWSIMATRPTTLTFNTYRVFPKSLLDMSMRGVFDRLTIQLFTTSFQQQKDL